MNIIDLDSENRFEPQLKEGTIKNVLVIEDNTDEFNIIQEILTEAIESSFELIRVDCLESGLEKLLAGSIDIVLLDLSLPDCQIQNTFSKLHEQTPDVPIIVMALPEEESLAVKATQLGAKDYIIKGKASSSQMRCMIKYAVEQHKIQDELESLVLIDKLTGLYSRQAFLVLGQHYLKLASRANKGLIFLMLNIENLKSISDNYDYQEKENALVDTAKILKQSFRRSDVIARYAEDSFAIIALEAREDSNKILINRLHQNLNAHKLKSKKAYTLALNIGTTYYDPKSPCSIAELMARARKALSGVKS